eukprot:scaffold201_cov405-Prasinococcus_capsulatus_cf.AAC.6
MLAAQLRKVQQGPAAAAAGALRRHRAAASTVQPRNARRREVFEGKSEAEEHRENRAPQPAIGVQELAPLA